MDGYGHVQLRTDEDENHKLIVTVLEADPIISIDTYLSSVNSRLAVHTHEDGNLVVGHINPVTYKPIKFANDGRVIICERVD